jgi:glutathione S-transferase
LATAVHKPALPGAHLSGLQVRHIIYQKGLEGDFDIVSPMELGGLGSEQYMALNPQNKMPILLLPNGQTLPESEVCDIFRYPGLFTTC